MAVRWRIATLSVAMAATLAAGTTTASAAPSAAVDKSDRDTPMGSQIAKREGGGPSMYAAGAGDDPTGGLQGIDVSRWQGEVDWQYWWDQGKRFAYVKATEGTYYTSPTFDQQYNGSADVGMKRGAYHFANPADSSGAAQANFFVDNGGGWTQDGKTLPGVVDLEWNPYPDEGDSCYDLSKSQLTAWINDFAQTYRERAGRFPVIYTSTAWWTQCVDSAAFAETSPLWIARYNSEVGTLPAGWSDWTFWQYSDDPIDQNKFHGTSAQLQELVDGPRPTAPTEVSAIGGVREATLNWQPPKWDGVGGVTKYQVSVSPGDKTFDVPASATSHKITGLATGTTYTFSVRAYSADGAGAVAHDKLVGTELRSTSLRPSTLVYGSSTRFSGKIIRVDTGGGAAGTKVVFQHLPYGSSDWRALSEVKAASDGSFSFTTNPKKHTSYRVIYWSGGPNYMGVYSAPRSVKVRQRVIASYSDSSVPRNTNTTLHGAVWPNHAGDTVYLQRYYNGAWRTVTTRTLSSTSKYSFTIRKVSAGTYYYRAVVRTHDDHYAGWSPRRTLTVY